MPNEVLRVADLRTAVGLALDAFESEHGPQIKIDHDYYWHLPVEASFDVSDEPTELMVGQVTDDLDEVRQFISSGDAAPAWHGPSHLIGLMRLMEKASLPGG